ncbi:MAG: hypothetical protein LC720_09170, partial [Actinobacteria bacterium]|nr:hypothetical protein [Actinomycetota bacterium]
MVGAALGGRLVIAAPPAPAQVKTVTQTLPDGTSLPTAVPDPSPSPPAPGPPGPAARVPPLDPAAAPDAQVALPSPTGVRTPSAAPGAPAAAPIGPAPAPVVAGARPELVTGQRMQRPQAPAGAPFGSPAATPPPASGAPPAADGLSPAVPAAAALLPVAPALSLAALGPIPIGVPDFFIENFQIPPFLLAIFQAAGVEYEVPWQVLAAINEIETNYGRNLSVSSAGALGW